MSVRSAISKLRARAGLALVRLRARRPRLIVDLGTRLGDFGLRRIGYETGLVKEEVSREHLFALPGEDLRFLDVGARDGKLHYLLGVRANLHHDPELHAANLARFRQKFEYWGLDLDSSAEQSNVLVGDVCSKTLLDEHPEFVGFFDAIYSNNVFEHLRHPWTAAGNLVRMLKPGGICITIAPFALRYHESPADYFRYTHTGLAALFEDAGPVRTRVSGYDLQGRRNNWQGVGDANDAVPTDRYGAWRENWFVVCIVERIT